MRKLTKLTDKQIERMHEFTKERISIQLNTISTPETEKEAEENLRLAYKAGGLDGDNIKIVWKDSPVEAMEELKKHYSVRDSVWDSVRDSVWAYDKANIYAFYGFFHEVLEPNKLQWLDRTNQLVSGYGLFENEAILIRKPRLLTLDENGRLHNEVQKCMEYRDGWGFYAWHGTRVPEYAITTPLNEVTKELWLKEENQEIKRVLVERVGYDKFMEWFKPATIDTWNDYKLHHIFEQVDGEELRLLQMKDTSTERIYFLRVPPTTKTCREAVAWSFQLDADKYLPEQES
jgi:hypothetical protein